MTMPTLTELWDINCVNRLGSHPHQYDFLQNCANQLHTPDMIMVVYLRV